MSKNKLFDEDSEEDEVSFKTENTYAKKYDDWRQKEELHKLEQKYGSNVLNADASESDSEDESDEPLEVSEETETQFLKTLALLKKKDPRIYDNNYKFFDEKTEEKKEEIKPETKSITFDDSDDDDSDDVNIFKVVKKAEIPTQKNEEQPKKDAAKAEKGNKLKDFLTGKVEHIDDPVEDDLAPLKALWSDTKLNEGEAFLRDYILNQKYLETGDTADAEGKLRDDAELEEDERQVEEQGQFERAYNFRFEEPDDEYLKRYPRTMNYTRPKDDRRARKRAEIRTRKDAEKQRKMDDIARLKALRLKDVKEKIDKIKQLTGNDELAFEEQDIEGDFDPAEHDRRMKALFDDQYYGGVDDQKPVFPDLDEELEIENWEKFDPEVARQEAQEDDPQDGPHCEDEEFNMDAEYVPSRPRATLLEEIQSSLGKKRRNRKKKTKLHEILAADKPKFVPTADDVSYSKFMDEYYNMDCEDIIGGDLPTRFKYREVVPNDYGLTIEEILLADDKELTQWVPLKKLVKQRPPGQDRADVAVYRKKAEDQELKRRLLPSLFNHLPEEPEIVVPVEKTIKNKKKKKKKNKEKQETDNSVNNIDPNDNDNKDSNQETREEDTAEGKRRKKKKKNNSKEDDCTIQDTDLEVKSSKIKHNTAEDDMEGVRPDVEVAEGSRKKKKKQKGDKTLVENSTESVEDSTQAKKKKHKIDALVTDEQENKRLEDGKVVESLTDVVSKKYKKKHKGSEGSETNIEASANSVNHNMKSIELNGKVKGKKRKSDGFVIEPVRKQGPSQKGNNTQNSAAQGQKQNRKRKLSQTEQGPNKKRNKKSKNQQNMSKNKQGKDQSSDNPLNKLSDERLKAYGLNPKKYRGFLKYKKF